MGKATIEFSDVLVGLCNKGWTPQRVQALLISVLRMHFADADKIQYDELKKKVWKADDTTGIFIEAAAKWKPTLTERRPGIVFARNAATILHLGLGGDRMQMNFGSGVSRRVHTDFYQGSHTVFCLAGESAEAELLASEVFNELNGFGQIIREKMNLHRFMVAEVGALSLLEESTENFVVPITVGYVWPVGWEVTTETAGPLGDSDMSIGLTTT